MNERKQSRVYYAIAGSIIILITGIYCLFLEMAFPNFLYLIMGGIMVVSSIYSLKRQEEQTASIVILFCAIFVLLTMNDLVYAILGDKTLSIGSGPNDYITFSVIERFIIILLITFGASCSIIGSIDGLMGKNNGFLKKLFELKLPYIVYLLDSILTIFMVGWVSFYLYITRSFIDSLIFLPIFLGLLFIFFYGWWTLNRMKNLGVVVIFNIICVILFGFFSLLNFFYFAVALLNVFSIGALQTATKEERKIRAEPIKSVLLRNMGIVAVFGNPCCSNDELRDNNEIVAGAFFGFHIFDFADLDDAQQDFFMISIVPPTNWEYIAAMVYQSGPGSNMSLLSYCNDMNYHFGDKGVPYAVTMNSDYDDVLTRLRIMKNSGFSKIGMWAMHELFANGTLFGMSGHKNSTPTLADLDFDGQIDDKVPDPWTPAEFIQLHEDLAEDGPVTFMFNGYNSENSYETLTLLLDMWLYRRPVYTEGWPIMGTRLPNNFLLKEIVTGLSFGAIGFFTTFISWNETRKNKKRSIPQEKKNIDQ